uniref:Uncharacterized protein n=1 Tax=Ditylenchus dipsaci TaxID=166011 RepID=A0A915CQS0_9BILA
MCNLLLLYKTAAAGLPAANWPILSSDLADGIQLVLTRKGYTSGVTPICGGGRQQEEQKGILTGSQRNDATFFYQTIRVGIHA